MPQRPLQRPRQLSLWLPSPSSSVVRNRVSDYIDIDGPDICNVVKAFLGSITIAEALSNAYISPVSVQASFKGFPRTYLVWGGTETLTDQCRLLQEMITADLGEENMAFIEFPDAVHDFCIFPFHEPKRTSALKGVAKWIDLV